MTRILGSSRSAIVASHRVRRSDRRHRDPRPASAPQPRHYDPRRQLPPAREAPLGADQNTCFVRADLGMSNGAKLDRGSPTGAHRYPPRIAAPDSWRSLRNARVPPVDSVDDPLCRRAAQPPTLGGQLFVPSGGQFRMSFDRLHQCPSERTGEGGPVRSPRVPSHVPGHPPTAAKVRGFSPIASGFTAETDWLLEGSGFELSVPLRRATTSELSVPPAVNAVGARLPRKRPGVSAVGLASRSSIMLPSPRALRGAEPFGPSDRVQRCPSASQQRPNRGSLSRSTLLS